MSGPFERLVRPKKRKSKSKKKQFSLPQRNAKKRQNRSASACRNHGTMESGKSTSYRKLEFPWPTTEDCDPELLKRLVLDSLSEATSFAKIELRAQIRTLESSGRRDRYKALERLYDIETVVLTMREPGKTIVLQSLGCNVGSKKVGLELIKAFIPVPELGDVSGTQHKNILSRRSDYYTAFVGARKNLVGPKQFARFLEAHGGVDGVVAEVREVRRKERKESDGRAFVASTKEAAFVNADRDERGPSEVRSADHVAQVVNDVMVISRRDRAGAVADVKPGPSIVLHLDPDLNDNFLKRPGFVLCLADRDVSPPRVTAIYGRLKDLIKDSEDAHGLLLALVNALRAKRVRECGEKEAGRKKGVNDE